MTNHYNPIEIEPKILDFWLSDETYKKVKNKNKGKKKFYFLDGPPYTSGEIHLGHALNKSLKDMVIRYKRLRGYDVWDRAGYDMHGLPIANEIQKKLDLKTKKEIIAYGIDKFVEKCKEFAMQSLERMNKDFMRLGIWMDFENAYQTISEEIINAEWFLVKKAYEQSRLYEGYRVMQWCKHCETALAKHELEYKTIKDRSIFVKFKIKDTKNEYLIIWTTTPWTIPFNLAIMVNPNLYYVKVRVNNDNKTEYWIVAEGLVNILMSSVFNKTYEIVEKKLGKELEGLEYEHPLYDILKDKYDALKKKSKNVHTVVLSEEYVGLDAGTGLVHCAPGCGPEDYEVGQAYGLEAFNEIDEKGHFPNDYGIFSGLIARDDDEKFVEELRKRGAILAETEVEHDYPHCWRCHKPVVFRLTKQWFFKVEDLRESLIKENDHIKWIPEAAYNAFNSWLRNLRDNNITRQRFWGAPVPIWKCEKCGHYKVIGSVDELRAEYGKEIKDLHRPYIDEVILICDKCGSEMRRIEDVLDVWIDSGVTAFASLGYPKNKELFESLYPADLILEGKDQIRGWFNMLHLCSFLAIGGKAYKAVYMHGFIKDAQGRKMSKSLKNYISPYEVIDKYGADTLRYYMIGGTDPGVDLNYNFNDIETKFRNLNILWNLHKYIMDLIKLWGIDVNKLDPLILLNLLDKEEEYIISKTNTTIRRVNELMDSYQFNKVPWVIEDLFISLSKEYIHYIREKVSKATLENNKEKKEVIVFTLIYTYDRILRMFSIVAPFITEAIYHNLSGILQKKEASVHLLDWPECDEKLIKPELEKIFKIANYIIQGILSLREKSGLGVRWPVKEVILVSDNKDIDKCLDELSDIIKKVTNIKDIRREETYTKLRYKVRANYEKLKQVYDEVTTAKIIEKTIEFSPQSIIKHLNNKGFVEFDIDGKAIKLTAEFFEIIESLPSNMVATNFRYGKVVMNKELDDELLSEGYAREIIRRVQLMRKQNGLKKEEEIVLYIKVSDRLEDLLYNKKDYIAQRVGAKKIKISILDPDRKHEFKKDFTIKKEVVHIEFDKIQSA